MPVRYFKTISMSVSASGTNEDSWTPETDVRISKIYVIGQGSVDLSQVDLYIEVAGDVKTKALVPAEIFSADNPTLPMLDWSITKGSKIYVKATNNSSSDYTIRIVFEVIT